jgi:transposase/AraC-like DNA-binding protein
MKIKHDQKFAIKTLRDANKGYATIAKQLGLSKSAVAKHCQREAHLAKLPPKEIKYKGKIQGRQHLQIKQCILYNPKDTLDDILINCDLNVSKSTLRRYLKRYNMEPKVAKSRIVISDINKRKRVEFCKEMLSKSDAELETIWFSDETMVKSRPNGEIVLYRCPPGSEYFEPSNGGGGKSVMFWGVISKNAYGPLVEVIGRNTAENYIETLKEYLLPEIEAAEGLVTFQQDNARIHKTDAVISFLKDNGIEPLKWPPQSPDLSPIENIWNVLKMKMKALKPRPRSYAKMRDSMLFIWENLGDDIREHLVSTFKDRLKKCLAAKGDLTKF